MLPRPSSRLEGSAISGFGMGTLYHRRGSRSLSGRVFARAFARFTGRRCRSLLFLFVLLLPLSFSWQRNAACDTRAPAPDTVVAASASQSPKRKPNFRIMVLTHSRADSLLRLLRSATAAHYDGDRVDLDIWVDRSLLPENEPTSLPGRLLRSLLPSRRRSAPADATVVAAASKFEWPHGAKAVHVWDTHVGIWGQWLESYRPSSASNAGAVLLEDDLEVSPQYYRWLRGARAAYGMRDDVFGYTLQRGTLRANATGFGRRGIKVRPSEKAFLYRLVGSWGYAPEAGQWMRFREWFHEASCRSGYHPYVEGLLPTKWYQKQEKGRTMWSMWHVKFADEQGLYSVYANLGGERTLAANWREPGLHFRRSDRKKASGVTKRRDFELLRDGDGVFSFPKEPRKLDWNGTFVGRDGIRTLQ